MVGRATSGANEPVGVSVEELIRRFPRLYHMAEVGSWDGIQRHGLLSTTALLDLFEVSGAERTSIESTRRGGSMPIEHKRHGRAIIRDQLPMDDKGLIRSLGDGLSPKDWYEILNGYVFFWLSQERLDKLLDARAYRGRRQTVLTVRTADLLARHAKNVVLSPINSGATKPYPQPRGKETFLPIDAYPFSSWDKKRRGRDPVVELAVRYSVPDVVDFVERVENVGGGEPAEVLFAKER